MRAALAAILLFAAAAPAPGQQRFNPAAAENRQVLATFNYGNVETVLTQIGARFERRGTAERPMLGVTFPNNRRGAIVFGACEQQGAVCKSISIQAIWPRPAAAAAAARLPGAIQAFNLRYAFARGYLTADGRPALQRYLTADYGFIRGNLAVNLLVFANQADRFAGEVMRAR